MLVLGVVGYLAVGVGFVRLIRRHLDSDAVLLCGFLVVLWPIESVVVALFLCVHGLGKLAGGK